MFENGYGKRTPVDEYRLSNRGGKGIKTATITERNGNIVCITTVTGEEDLMVVTNAGVIIRLDVEDISQNGRAAQGVRLMRLGEGQFVSTVAKVKEEEDNQADSDDTDASETATEEVINDQTPGNAIHTEEAEDVTMKKQTITLMMIESMFDKTLWIVNEDIESASDDDDDNE